MYITRLNTVHNSSVFLQVYFWGRILWNEVFVASVDKSIFIDEFYFLSRETTSIKSCRLLRWTKKSHAPPTECELPLTVNYLYGHVFLFDKPSSDLLNKQVSNWRVLWPRR